MQVGDGVNERHALQRPAPGPPVCRIAPDHAGLVMRQVLKQPGMDRARVGEVEIARYGIFMELLDPREDKPALAPIIRAIAHTPARLWMAAECSAPEISPSI